MIGNLEKALKTFFHIPPPLRAPGAHPDYILADCERDPELKAEFFTFEKNGEYFYHGVQISKIPGTFFTDLRTPYGYGGPLSSTEDAEFLKSAWESYSNWCREKNVVAELIRFHPLLENWKYYEGSVFFDRNSVAVDLRSPDILSTYLVRARTAVRKAEKNGLSLKWENKFEFLDLFLKIYNESLKGLQASSFYFFPRTYYEKLLSSSLTHMAVVRQNSEPVAVGLFLIEGTKLEYHLSGSTSLGKTLGASNLLLHEAFTKAQSLGCEMAHLGGGTDADPQNPLLFFKQGFSPLTTKFQLGERIHNPSAYEALKKDRLGQGKDVGKKVLFYR